MKKGCIIAIVVVVALAVVGIALFVIVGLPKLKNFGTAGFIVATETAVDMYVAEFGEAPKGNHEKVIEILRGNNPKEKNFLGSELDGAIVDGKVADVWRRPLKMNRAADGSLSFTSAGPNGEHGDEDDVTGAAVRDLVGKIQEKAAE